MNIDYFPVEFDPEGQKDLIFQGAKIKQIDPEKGHFVCLSAQEGKTRVGLAVAYFFYKNKGAQLYSLFVDEKYRGKGIGRALFEKILEKLVVEEKATVIGVEFLEEPYYAPLFEKILERAGWPTPKIYMWRCYFDGFTFDPNWWHYSIDLPSGMAFFSWKDLTTEDRETMQRLKGQGEILSPLWPFHDLERLDEGTSVGLRKDNEIIGWCVTHLTDPETLRYSILYLVKEYHHSGLGIQILVESLLRQKKRFSDTPPLRYAFFELHLSHVPDSWVRSVKKRLVPHTERVEKIKWGAKFFPENF
ncbi:MAG: GNAT family N-acetyltransferase [Parachlamydia sp.]|nr:GNAT family N-acetyltransferase [Parachlamydia sp.]